MKKENIFAIIVARAGSKGLKHKNTLLLSGRPLVTYTIDAALNCPQISHTIVSTDDNRIKEICLRRQVEVIDRPKELAGDSARSQDVVEHVLKKLRKNNKLPKFFVLLQPTSPFRAAGHLSACLKEFLKSGVNCSISVTEARHNPYKQFSLKNKRLSPLFSVEKLHEPRQLLPKIYRQNGAIYVMSSELFLKKKTFFVPPVLPFVMDEASSIDIDTPLDLKFAESLKSENGSPMNQDPCSFHSEVARRTGKKIDLKYLGRNTVFLKKIAREQKILANRLYNFREKIKSCPICKSHRSKFFVEVYRYPYVECLDCGHIYCQTPPKAGAVNRLYAGKKGERCPQDSVYAHETIFNKRIKCITRPKVDFVKSILKPGGIWVDIGCGTGELLIAAREAGWQVKGVEADPVEISFARKKGLKVCCGYVTGGNVAGYLRGARIVSFINVLEHIKSPVDVLKRAVKGLKLRSYLVIELPRHPSLSSFNNLAFPQLAYRHIYPPDHLHVFTERSAELMLHKSGLKAIAVWDFGQDLYDLILLAAANAGLQKSSYYERIINQAFNLQIYLDKHGFSDSMFIICEKIKNI
ncbi:MAG: methyltransferase domain-containing protein [Candidatus Omnitrophota bacterium]